MALVLSLTTARVHAAAATNNLVLTTLITAPTHSAHLFAWVDNKGEFAIDTVVKKNRRGVVLKLVSATCIDRLGHAAWKMIPNANGTRVTIIGTNGTSIVIKANKARLTALVSLYVGKQRVSSYTTSLAGTHYFETFAAISASVKRLRACGPIVPGYDIPVSVLTDGSLSNLVNGAAISIHATVKAELNCLALYLAKICAIISSSVIELSDPGGHEDAASAGHASSVSPASVMSTRASARRLIVGGGAVEFPARSQDNASSRTKPPFFMVFMVIARRWRMYRRTRKKT